MIIASSPLARIQVNAGYRYHRLRRRMRDTSRRHKAQGYRGRLCL